MKNRLNTTEKERIIELSGELKKNSFKYINTVDNFFDFFLFLDKIHQYDLNVYYINVITTK